MLGVFCIFFDVRNFRAIRNLPCGHNPVRIPPVESPNRPSAAGSKNHRFFGFSGYPRKTGFSGSSGPRIRISGVRTPKTPNRDPDPESGNRGVRRIWQTFCRGSKCCCRDREVEIRDLLDVQKLQDVNVGSSLRRCRLLSNSE